MTQHKQQVLVLYLAPSALDSEVKAWASYDGTGHDHHTTGDSNEPPYADGMAALFDGWRVIQFPQLIPPYPGEEFSTSFMKYMFVFEKIVEVGK